MCELCPPATARFSRRRLMVSAASLTLAAAASPLMPAWAAEPLPEPNPNAIAPDAALDRLMKGNARYAANAPEQRDFSAGRAARATVQYPIAAILSCADSRVGPELLFDQGPGEIFVVRLAGNFVNEDGLASLEYAVKVLGVPFVMVLGHSNCGAVDAAIKVVQQGITLPGHLPGLIEAIKPAVIAAEAKKPADLLAAATEENVRLNVQRLHDDKPIVSEALAAKTVGVAGGVYDLATGKVTLT
jgi:carbonic anhydrase